MINQKRLVKTFIDLVKIDSPSGEEILIAKEMAKRLKTLGGKVKFDSFGNVIAKFDGLGEPLMLNAHLDTVEPGRAIKPKISGNFIKSDGSTIVGADDKAGLSIILEALVSVKEDKADHLPLEIVLTLGEESGLFGATNLDYTKISSRQGVAFDGHGGVGNITVSAPGLNRVDVTVIGRSAHAGVEPEKGISAIEIASKIISGLNLGRIDEETTANVGLIEGGSARNAVAERVHFKGEIRSRDLKKLEKHALHFRETADNVMVNFSEARLEFEIVSEAGPYSLAEDTSIVQRAVELCKKLGIKPEVAPTGGLSDVNIFNTHGISVLDVGTGAHELHTTRETLNIKEFVEAAKFCYALIQER